MEKIDLLKNMKGFFTASSKEVYFLEIPDLYYLMIDGHGDPNTNPFYKDALQALYSLAYSIKFDMKKGQQHIDTKVMPLEGLWWVQDMREFSAAKKEDWDWTMMILQPEMITQAIVEENKHRVLNKKGLAYVEKVHLDFFHEGLCAQILHLGPYAAEGLTIAKLHAAILKQGYKLNGKHHEIYLNTPLRTATEKLKTIIRQPIRK